MATTSNYTVNLGAVRDLFGRTPETTGSAEDLFNTWVELPGRDPLVVPTHRRPDAAIVPILYDNALEERQTDIVRFFDEDEVFICVKHHKLEHPTLGGDPKEAVKFNATHIGVGVVVPLPGGGVGAITLNSPQIHEKGLFGVPKYPMIFLRLVFPPGIDADARRAYLDNIRTWLVIANTYTDFPNDYNGGDPLGTRSVGSIGTLAEKLLDSLVGTQTQQADASFWLSDPANQVYCAELAHVAVNLGVHCPLNRAALGNRYDAVAAQLESKAFLATNVNTRAPLVRLTMAPETLAPIASALGVTPTVAGPGEPCGVGLALRPLTITNMLEEFLQLVPRDRLGEDVAPIQAAMLDKVRPGLLEQMGLDLLPEDDPKRVAIDRLLDALRECIGGTYGSYEEFRTALAPLLGRARQVSGPRPDGAGAFMPPHAWLLHALGRLDNTGCLLGVEVVGHGFHASLLTSVEP